VSSSQYPRWSSIRQLVADAVLAAAGIACLANGVFSLWTGNLPSSGMGLTAGLVLLLAASVERFEVLKGLGVEARTRKLDEAISQANATVEQLRELAEMSGAALVSLNSKAGRWSVPPSPQESYATAQRVRKHLESLGTSSEILREVLAPWVKVTTVDVVHILLKNIQRPLLLAEEQLNQRLKSFPTPIAAGDPDFQALLSERNKYGSFICNFVGELNDWPPGTHADRIQTIVREMPLLDEMDRLRLKEYVAPWVKRITHLARHNDLLD